MDFDKGQLIEENATFSADKDKQPGTINPLPVECKQRRGVDGRVNWVINPIDVDVNTYEHFQKASIKSCKLNQKIYNGPMCTA